MKRTLTIILLLTIAAGHLCAQPLKSTENIEQIWMGYSGQARFTNKWGMWADFHLRTKEELTNSFSQSILRLGLTYYVNNNTKFTLGYGRIFIYPGDNHKGITQTEHRPWQQLQWHTAFKKTKLMQWIRLEERFRRKIATDSTLGDGHNFNWRLRYNIWYEIPLLNDGVLAHSVSFIANDELHINFGKEIVYNYYDQNRLFLGLKYQVSKSSNVQFGYMNLFQQLSPGNRYKNIHAARIFFFQNFDFRKK
ncbi:MAG: DUF2490 domain-containing protein [Chitinophagaceae bacterium]